MQRIDDVYKEAKVVRGDHDQEEKSAEAEYTDDSDDCDGLNAIDVRAEEFVAAFYQQTRLQRLDSIKRCKERRDDGERGKENCSFLCCFMYGFLTPQPLDSRAVMRTWITKRTITHVAHGEQESVSVYGYSCACIRVALEAILPPTSHQAPIPSLLYAMLPAFSFSLINDQYQISEKNSYSSSLLQTKNLKLAEPMWGGIKTSTGNSSIPIRRLALDLYPSFIWDGEFELGDYRAAVTAEQGSMHNQKEDMPPICLCAKPCLICEDKYSTAYACVCYGIPAPRPRIDDKFIGMADKFSNRLKVEAGSTNYKNDSLMQFVRHDRDTSCLCAKPCLICEDKYSKAYACICHGILKRGPNTCDKFISVADKITTMLKGEADSTAYEDDSFVQSGECDYKTGCSTCEERYSVPYICLCSEN
ncbi:hypothetical protein ACLOJK_026392 [Asimina triloba]